MSTPRALWAGARMGLRHTFAYRGEVAVQLVSTGAMCLLIGTLWSKAGGAYAAPAVLGQIAATAFATRVNEELGLKIRDGTIAADLTRPMPVALQLYSRDLGRAIGALLLVGLPMLAAALAFGVVELVPPLAWATWLVSLWIAHLVNFALSFAIGASAVWYQHIYGLQQVKATLVGLLSGTMIPLVALPDVVRPWVERLPFWVMAAGPTRVLGGEPGVMIDQLLWCAAMWAFGLGVWALARRKLTVQGG